MAVFGPDFLKARREWLYNTADRPGFALALLSLAGLVILIALLQTTSGLAVYFIQQGISAGSFAAADSQSNFARATLIGMLPAGALTALAAWWLARVSGAPGRRGMPLHMPRLGLFGWLVVVLGFIAAVYLLFFVFFTALGIDPQDYMPKSGGLADDPSRAGLAEKILADLARQPWLFALTLPGVTIAMPLAEELVFRGPIFAALAGSRAGGAGAVVLTAAAWALVHLTAPWAAVAVIFLMGLVLGLLLLRFGSLWVTIVCHSIWNAMTSLAIFTAQGLPPGQ